MGEEIDLWQEGKSWDHSEPIRHANLIGDIGHVLHSIHFAIQSALDMAPAPPNEQYRTGAQTALETVARIFGFPSLIEVDPRDRGSDGFHHNVYLHSHARELLASAQLALEQTQRNGAVLTDENFTQGVRDAIGQVAVALGLVHIRDVRPVLQCPGDVGTKSYLVARKPTRQIEPRRAPTVTDNYYLAGNARTQPDLQDLEEYLGYHNIEVRATCDLRRIEENGCWQICHVTEITFANISTQRVDMAERLLQRWADEHRQVVLGRRPGA